MAHRTRKNYFISIIISTTVFFVATLFPSMVFHDTGILFSYKHVEAQQFTFGGTVTVITFCACSANFLVMIGPPVPALLVYTPGTQRYQNFNMPFARYALGFYSPGGTCLIPAGPACVGIVPQGIITTVGSSL